MNETWWIGEEQLDEDQKKIIALKPEGNHIISGPPGSGKTNILLLRAKYMIMAGHQNVQAVVFTRTLQEFVTLGGLEYQLPAGTLKTLARWEYDFLYENGMFLQPQGSFEDIRMQLVVAIEDVIRNKKLKGIYDAFFLDEAQDYLPREIEIFKVLGKNIFAAVDSRQKIYAGKDCYKILKQDAMEHVLHFHYRIGKNICRLADEIMANVGDDTLLKTARYDEDARPSSVVGTSCSDLDEQIAKIIDRLRVQVQAYPDELIGVVCPKNDQVERIWQAVQQSDVASLAIKQVAKDRVPFEQDKPICICTIHSAKGLEFRALHIACCEDLGTWPNHRNLTYTAVTRAKTSLNLYYSGTIQGYLRQALQQFAPKPKAPTVGDLFTKGKK